MAKLQDETREGINDDNNVLNTNFYQQYLFLFIGSRHLEPSSVILQPVVIVGIPANRGPRRKSGFADPVLCVNPPFRIRHTRTSHTHNLLDTWLDMGSVSNLLQLG